MPNKPDPAAQMARAIELRNEADAIEADIARNVEALKALGVDAETFAFPYGDVSPWAKRILSGRYSIMRGLHHGLIEDGTDLNQAPAVGIEGPEGEAVAGRWLEREGPIFLVE